MTSKVVLGAGALLLVLCLITGATMVTFKPVITGQPDEVRGLYDVYRYFGPITFFLDYSIHSGEFPLWNPLTYCGMPLTGNPQSFLFYPPNLVRALLTTNPTPARSNISLAIMWGLHLIFMAFCTYLLGRSHKLTIPGALAAAIAFAFSALIIRRMCEYHFITTMAWLPLLLLLIKKMIEARDFFTKIGTAIFAGLVMGMSIMGGYLQIANLAMLLPALYGLFYFFTSGCWRETEGSWKRWLRLWLDNGIAMAIVFCLGIGVAAVTLIPAWQLGSFSVRTEGTSLGTFSDLWKWTPLDFYQKMVLYGGIKYEAETIRNAGITALLLACAALTHQRRREVFMFAALYFILLECSFGPPLPLGGLLAKVTPFTLTAYSRAYDFGLLPLALLVGYGVDAISRPMSEKGLSYARAIVLLLVAYVCLAPASAWVKEIQFIRVNSNVIIIPAMAAALIVCAGMLRLNNVGRLVAGFLLVLLLFSETLAWNHAYVPFMTLRKLKDVIEIKQEGHAIPTTNFRETDHICNRFLYDTRFAMNGLDPMHLKDVRGMLSGPPREGAGFRGVQDWEPTRANMRGNLLFKRSFWLAQNYALGELPGKKELFPSATTVFLGEEISAPVPKVERRQLPATAVSEKVQSVDITAPANLFQQVPSGSKKTLAFTQQMPTSAPGGPQGSAGSLHSTLAYSCKSGANAVIDFTFIQPGTDRAEMGFRHTVRPASDRIMQFEVPMPDFPVVQARIAIENKGPGAFEFTAIQIKSDLQDEDGLIQILARTANTVDLQVGPLEGHRILTFLDAFYPGWEATVNGEPAPILRANQHFKAVVLPPGTHQVSFVFRPQLTLWSLMISVGTLALACVLLLVCWRFRLPGVAIESNQDFLLEVKYDSGGRPYPPEIKSS